MRKRWLRFHTSHSPIKIDTTQLDNWEQVIKDWKRADWDITYINKIPLSHIMNKKGISKTTMTAEDLENFFKEVLLQQVPTEKKEMALQYLKKSLHQGGLLNPASSALDFIFLDQLFGPRDSTKIRQVNIVTNENGFTIQEISTAKTFALKPTATPELEKKYPDSSIPPDPSQKFCMEAQATLNVSFSGEKEEIKVISTNISYGNEFLQGLADARGWYQKFTDFIKNIFGLNSVEDLSYPEEPTSPNFKV